jgi:hypothetical protein
MIDSQRQRYIASSAVSGKPASRRPQRPAHIERGMQLPGRGAHGGMEMETRPDDRGKAIPRCHGCRHSGAETQNFPNRNVLDAGIGTCLPSRCNKSDDASNKRDRHGNEPIMPRGITCPVDAIQRQGASSPEISDPTTYTNTPHSSRHPRPHLTHVKTGTRR